MDGLHLIHRADHDYEVARRDAVWNARMPDRYPEAIAIVENEEAVVAAVAIARERGWHIAIRSGGHNFVGNAVRDGGMLLDLSRMRDVVIDAAAATATVQPGADNERFIELLSSQGLTFSVGHCPSVCLGGFLLGGGLGFNTGEWGYANESVFGIDVVTADGRRVHASEEQNADLFWAARGSGPGFFGVVTRYHLRLATHPEGLWSSSLTFPLSALERVTAWLDEITPTLDPRVEPMGWIGFLQGHEIGTNEEPNLPAAAKTDPGERVFLLNSLVYASSDEEAQLLMEPITHTPFDAELLARTVVKTSFPELFDFQRVLYKKGRRYAVDCHWTNTPPAEQPLDHLAKQMDAAPSARTHVLWQLPFGNYRKDQPDMAASILGRYFVSVYAVWEDEEHDERNIAWLRETLEPFEAISTGHYAGDVDLTARESRGRRTLSAERWERYRWVRDAWDPQNLFHSHLSFDDIP